MSETIFVLFLLSGLIKSFLLFFAGNLLIVDITLLLAVFLIGILLIETYKNAFARNEFYFPSDSRTILFTLVFLYVWMIASLYYTPSPRYCYAKIFLFLTNIIAAVFPFLYSSFNTRRFFRVFAYTGSGLVLFYSKLLPTIYDSYLRNTTDKEFVLKYLDVGFLAGILVLIVLFGCPGMNRIFKILLIGLNGWAILISAARGPLLFLLFILFIRAAVSIYKFFRTSWTFKFKNILYLFTGFGIVAAGIYYIMDKYSVLLERSLTRLSQVTDSASASVSERVVMISFSIDKTLENGYRFLFGYGIGSYGILYGGIDGRLYPHNVILEIAFELGIMGVLIFLFLLFLYTRKIRYNLNYLLIFAYLLLNSLKSYSLIDLRIMFGILSVLVILTGHELKKKDESLSPVEEKSNS